MTSVGSRVTHDTVLANFLAASLKLRLDQADTHGVRRSDSLCHRENMMQRDKRDIHAEKRNGLFQHIRGNIADVRPLHIHHPLVGAQAPGQLAVANIHRVDLDRTVLQHTIGKTAGRGTNVHTDFSIRGQREALHRFFQLQAAAADITDIMATHFHFGIFFDHFTGFVHFLLVDKDNTCHDHGFGALTALDESVLHQILVQSNFQTLASPFASGACTASRTACARCSASSPVTCLIWGTVAWGRQSCSTAV